MGHEFLGVIEDLGSEVQGFKRGDVVVAPFVWSDNTCDFWDRTDLGLEFGATDIIAERGDEGIERIRELTGGDGTHTVLECVGTQDAINTAIAAVRDGGAVGRVGAAQYTDVPMNFGTVMRNITLTGGVAPARAYIEELIPGILAGTIQPGKVFDHTVALDDVPAGYRAMADRTALKVLIRP